MCELELSANWGHFLYLAAEAPACHNRPLKTHNCGAVSGDILVPCVRVCVEGVGGGGESVCVRVCAFFM